MIFVLPQKRLSENNLVELKRGICMEIIVVLSLELDLFWRETFGFTHQINSCSDIAILLWEWLHLGHKRIAKFGIKPDDTHLDYCSCQEEDNGEVLLGPLHNFHYKEEDGHR